MESLRSVEYKIRLWDMGHGSADALSCFIFFFAALRLCVRKRQKWTCRRHTLTPHSEFRTPHSVSLPQFPVSSFKFQRASVSFASPATLVGIPKFMQVAISSGRISP